MILKLLILHKATAKIRSFLETLLKKKKYWVIIFNNNSREDIYLIFPKTKKDLKKMFHILTIRFSFIGTWRSDLRHAFLLGYGRECGIPHAIGFNIPKMHKRQSANKVPLSNNERPKLLCLSCLIFEFLQ